MGKLEFIFPLIAAVYVNRKIKMKKNVSYQDIFSKWLELLKKSSISEEHIDSIAHRIYASEEKRTSDIENKGSWLLVGVGIAISLLSIILGFSWDDDLLIQQIIAIGFFLWSIANLILSGIGAHKTMKIGSRYILGIDDFSKTLVDTQNSKILNWAANHLASVESNLDLIIQKSNLIDVSQQHFVRGLFFMAIGFALLSWGVVSNIFSSQIPLQGLEFLGNFTNP